MSADRPKLLPTRTTTLRKLEELRRPSSIPATRMPSTNYRRRQMGIARQRLLKAYEASCGVTQVTGVLFFSTRPKTLRERLAQLRPILRVETGCS